MRRARLLPPEGLTVALLFVLLSLWNYYNIERSRELPVSPPAAGAPKADPGPPALPWMPEDDDPGAVDLGKCPWGPYAESGDDLLMEWFGLREA